MSRQLDPRIAEVLRTYGEDPSDRQGVIWDCHGTWVVYHKALERVAARAGVSFDKPDILRAERDEAVILVSGRMGERVDWEIGEALINVNYRVSGRQAAYVYAMALKRGRDRLILKLVGLHGLIYSEEEADEFKQGGSRQQDDDPVVIASASIADAMIEGLSKRQGSDAVNAFLSHQKVAADIERLTPADRDRVMTVANGRRQVAAARAAS